AILAMLVLAFTGVSVFHTPSGEVMYSKTRMAYKEDEKGAKMVTYSIEVGNTGTKVQENVRLRFVRQAMDRAILKPSASNFGVTPRPIAVSNDQSSTTIDLGKLEPEKRVRIYFILLYPKGQEPHTWEDMFLGVEPEKGHAKYGDPGMTMVGRAWFSLFGRWLPF
ncbi:MAG: hypothetical protein PHR77_20070, partial [Kiritimatiellae bacterium]|nr:hypothetical protein [Kiritimatiellia bacterium]